MMDKLNQIGASKKARLLFSEALHILNTLEQNGYAAFFVGGCIRDLLLQQDFHDIDICTSAPPNVIMRLFTQSIPTGLKHGTVTVRLNQVAYEVSTFKAKTEGQSELEALREDLALRDFTINAMAMDKEGRVYDFFSGQEAIAQGYLKAVGSAEERLNEDPLRMLRAIRFAAQLCFEIDSTLIEVIQLNGALIEATAIERRYAEWDKLFSSAHPTYGLKLLNDSGLSAYGPFSKLKQTLSQAIKYDLDSLSEEARYVLLYLVSRSFNENVLGFVKQSTLPKGKKLELNRCLLLAKRLAGIPLNALQPRHLYSYEWDVIQSYLSAVSLWREEDWDEAVQYRIIAMYDNLPIRNQCELQVNGAELCALFPKRKPGAWVASLLKQTEDAVLIGQIKNCPQEIQHFILERSSEAEGSGESSE